MAKTAVSCFSEFSAEHNHKSVFFRQHGRTVGSCSDLLRFHPETQDVPVPSSSAVPAILHGGLLHCFVSVRWRVPSFLNRNPSLFRRIELICDFFMRSPRVSRISSSVISGVDSTSCLIRSSPASSSSPVLPQLRLSDSTL